MSTHSYETVKNVELNNMVDKHITRDWVCNIQFYNCLHFVEPIQLSPHYSNGNTHIQKLEHCSTTSDIDVYGFVVSVDKTKILNHNDVIIELNKLFFWIT